MYMLSVKDTVMEMHLFMELSLMLLLFSLHFADSLTESWTFTAGSFLR